MFRDLLIVAVVLATGAGCSSSSASKDGGPGLGGLGGASGSGGAGGAVNCQPLNDGGTSCWCASALSNSLSECSGASVAATDHGYCCSGGGFCTCYQTACVNVPTIGYCQCGKPFDDTNPRVDSCPQPAGGICCMYTTLEPADCYCNDTATTCVSGTTQVASCTLAEVMKCGAGSTVVDSCK